MVILATSMNAEAKIKSNTIMFDSDSAAVGIDNQCSACISHISEDFVGDLVDSKRIVKGFTGTRTSGINIGTL